MAYLSPRELALLMLCRPELAPKVLAAMSCFEARTGRTCFVSEGYRTTARQATLYADSLNARTGAQMYRVARPGTSRHELGSAADIHITGIESQTDPLYRVLGACVEAQGLTWGGRFPGLPDVYHCELKEPYTVALARWRVLRGSHL